MRPLGLVIAALLVCPVTAAAHIHLTAPTARTDSMTGDQKDQHCGVAGQVRTTRVTAFRPGDTVTVTWLETINHPGYYRIALQPNGDVFPIPPEGATAGAFPTVDQTGMTDTATGALIIKDRIPDGMLTTQITLPTMECNNCTLQFIQVMTDKPPYTTDAASDDIYFNCADITISANAPTADAGVGEPDAPPGTGNNPSTSGGCSTSGGAELLAGFALLGLVIRRRRRA